MPKVKYDREDVLNSAYEIMKQEGIKNISARKIAAKLKSSTAPIYANFNTIEDLKNQIIKISEEKLREYLNKSHTGREIFDAAVGFIRFARDEKELFRAIFLDASEGFNKLFNETMDRLLKEEVVIKSFPNISYEISKKGIENLWIQIFGYATLIFVNPKSNIEETDEIIENNINDLADYFREIHHLRSIIKED